MVNMFKFDFQLEAENVENAFNAKAREENTHLNNEKAVTDSEIVWYESEEILPDVDILEQLDVYRLNAVEKELGNIAINYVVSGFLLENVLNKDDIGKAELKHSDLLPGIYEGGAKIWECTDDLLAYLSENYERSAWQNKRVLDLGCGSGLLGIYAYKCGAKVHFQDYNADVLRNITIPNILLNNDIATEATLMQLQATLAEFKFYSGDWEKFSQLTQNAEKFDFILTSETIYNAENQQKLIDTFAARLSEHGVVLLAAKTHYFGVGGGLRQFETLLAKDKNFQYKIVHTTQSAGVAREILLLKRNLS